MTFIAKVCNLNPNRTESRVDAAAPIPPAVAPVRRMDWIARGPLEHMHGQSTCSPTMLQHVSLYDLILIGHNRAPDLSAVDVIALQRKDSPLKA